ncbi:MAG: protein kinase [Alphaproteobacteria bacterium]|nr:protein kinase [Alphaproteobacteria bacterium]
MAELWLAHRTGRPDDMVAIKRILPQFAQDREFVDMFLDEARIASHLQHPNVVRTFEVGSDGTAYFIVMEFLDGENVRAILRQLRSLGRPLGVQHALAILIGTAQGLHYAHEKTGTDDKPLHIVHRDVSPQNIIVTRRGEVKLVDFGIAKAAHRATETRVGTMKGKIPYMSPEQCSGEALDRRSDVWSLGVVLYELTVGRRMIRKAPDYLMMKQITEEGVTPPTSILPMYPRELEAILLKALAPRRGQRYQTMAHLAADLAEFAQSQRYDLGGASLASMMREAFGADGREHDDLDEPAITEEEPLPAALPEVRPRSVAVTWTPGPVDPRRGQRSGIGAPEVHRRRVGSVEVVSVAGRLTEAFRGAELGATLAGDVVLDLSGIQRVTSFGVREWLSMNDASRASSLYLARCTEPIVNQLTMIRGFAGRGKVLSFLAPYVCVSCGKPFSRLVDAEADAQAVRDQVPPPAACPSCGGEGRFDDDPRSYFAIASLLADVVPPAVRAATGPVDTVGRPPLEKRIEDRVTRLLVNGRLTPDLRWRNALEGVDGDLVLDLTGVDAVSPDAARPMLSALRTARPDLRAASLVGVPSELMPELSHESWLTVEERRTAPPVDDEPPEVGTATAPALLPAPEVQEQDLQPAPSILGMGVGAVLMVIGGLAVVAAGFAALAFVLLTRVEPEPIAPAPEPARGVATAPFVLGEDAAVANGEGRGATVEAAAEVAREQALTRIVDGVTAAVGRDVRGPRASDPVRRYLDAFGAIGTPTRGDVRTGEDGGEVVVVASYTLPRRSFDEVVGRLSVVELGGLRLAPALPVEEGEGMWVLASSDPELPVGALIVAVDGVRWSSGATPPALRGRSVTLIDGERERTVRLP